MIIVIPLGGVGLRFSQNGYKQPKALINVLGKPLIYWLIDSLKIPPNTTVCIPYNNVYARFRFESMLMKQYPHIRFMFLCLNSDTGGAAETIYQCLNALTEEDQPVLCLDSDNFYTCDVINLWDGTNKVLTFSDTQENPIYSYVRVEKETNRIMDIIEKEKISDQACCGGYGFESWKQLETKCKYVLDKDIRQRGEYYTSTVIREMLQDGIIFQNVHIDAKNYICLGTPIQVRLFCHNYPRYSSLNNNCLIEPKRYCFDLDNTLVTFPKIQNDYSTVEPILKNIELLRYIKRFGHTIIIYTARRMKTHQGNVGKIMQDIGKLTLDTLIKYDIPYDEIYFGKPEANVYVDDLAMNCFDDLEKELGYYKTMIQPRDFNTIRSGTIEVCTKTSANLDGEIYYFKNIPNSVKDMFPIMLDYDVNNTWYSIEKINGITVSNLYMSHLLTEDQLKHIMNSIFRLQQADDTVLDKNLNILDNYIPKMRERYHNYDYSRFRGHKELFESIVQKLDVYCGKQAVIHGDPVFSNILINNYGKIKFIDMRGKVGNSRLTTNGDFLYDWAKMYQSLIGYDEIHEEVHLDPEYKTRMIRFFEAYFEELFEDKDHVKLNNVKAITKCLLFSLIPLHDNKKCDKYYALIKSIEQNNKHLFLL